MQLVLDDHRMNPGLVARFMDVATFDEGSDISRLESHMLNGILSRREMIRKGLEITIPSFMQCQLHTPDHEISVFDMNEFSYQIESEFRQIALLIPRSITSNSSILTKEIDHPIIADSVPIADRKILGIYLGNRDMETYHSVQELCNRTIGKTLPIIYGSGKFGRFEVTSD